MSIDQKITVTKWRHAEMSPLTLQGDAGSSLKSACEIMGEEDTSKLTFETFEMLRSDLEALPEWDG